MLRASGPHSAEDWIDAFALGAASSFCLLYVGALLSLKLFWWIWIAAAVAAVAWARFASVRLRFEWSAEARPLCGLLLLYLALRLLPAFFQEFPQGWDPYFHLVLADKVAQAGRLVTDWMPYETANLNYPLGAHVLLALASNTLGVPLHKVFVIAVAFFTALTAAQVHVVAWRATGDRELALYAATGYAFMAVMGSLDYLRWGGLPNVIGVYLFLGLLSLLMQQGPWGWASRTAFAVFFVGLSLVHHHAMLAAGLSLGWVLLHFAAKKDLPGAGRILQGLALSAVLGSPYFGAYLLRSPPVQDTSIFTYLEKVITPEILLQDFGPVFFVTVLCGVMIYFFGRSKRTFSPVLLQSLAGLLLCFVLLEYGSRFASRYLFGQEIAPFTPYRFMTDAVALLSVFSGLFLLELRLLLARTGHFVLALFAACFVFNFTLYARAFQTVIPPEKLAAFAWLREHAEPDAIVFDESLAASYLTRRASSHMPYPASEPVSSTTVRPLVAEMLKSGKVPAQAGRRRLIHLYSGDARSISPSQILWAHPSGVMVAVELNPARRPVPSAK